MNIDLALEKIYSLKQFNVKLGLDNIKALLNHIGNPQNNLKAIHVAGSNGKGSTCSFISSILQENGFKVGLYTSPHFVNFNERIRINGTEIKDSEIIEFLENNKKYVDEYRPTFFEITTAMAFDYFNKKNVEYAVIETGLGGRLDATNLLLPLASVITPISLEHSHILGDSLEKIAYEKGGIIKSGMPVLIAVMDKMAEDKLNAIASEKQSQLFSMKQYWDQETRTLYLKNGALIIENSGLRGDHQLHNAALAALTSNSILDIEDHVIIKRGIRNVEQNTGIQGRYEKIGPNNNIIFDAAHNLEGVKIFLDEFKKEYQKYNNRTLIFGAMRDKDIKKMLLFLKPFFDDIYIASPDIERAATVDEIIEIAKSLDMHSEMLKNFNTIHKRHTFSDNKDCLVVLGSIYLLGDIKKKIIT